VFDLLSDVACSARVFDLDAADDGERLVLATAILARGEGISDPRAWLRDALVALAETL
jgi:hypothetical protein